MRIKFKRSSLLTLVIIMILLVYAMVSLVHLQRQLSAKQDEHQALETQINQVQQANVDLENRINALDTDEGVEDVAREQFGWVSEGEVTFYDIGD